MASIMKRGNTYSVRYNYKDHAGKPCKGWETFKTKAEAQERKITVEKELLDGTFLVPNTMTCLLYTSLEEINQEIVQQAVAAHGGNRAAAARQLGISRTTLWRYLSKSEE